MRIAQIAPLAERVPPKTYGGTERVVHALTEELVKRGHEVTLFASGDSVTSAKLVSVFPNSIREAGIKKTSEKQAIGMMNAGLAFQEQDQFDIIHHHAGLNALAAANISPTPVIITQHGNLNNISRQTLRLFRKPYLVSISNSQKRREPGLNYFGTVYNGLEMDDYPFSPRAGSYLLFVGRISPEKAPHLAIEAASKTGLPLIIAAKLDEADREYYIKKVKPFLSKDIRWIGEVSLKERNELYSRALAFLHPATWEEPFGLTLIEAMACGTPVIAFNKGAIPEIILNKKTGFIVNDFQEMISAIKQIEKISRYSCRDHARNKFSAKKMTDGYEDLYRRVVEENFRKRWKKFINYYIPLEKTQADFNLPDYADDN